VRYAIISDLHANIQALSAVLDVIDRSDVDQILCLGDVVGYNADPNACVEAMRQRSIVTICGNHDAVACGIEEPWGFNPIALSAALWTRENVTQDNLEWLRSLPDYLEFEGFMIVHGSPTDRDSYLFSWEDVLPHLPFMQAQGCSLCFFGHTHSPGIFSSDGIYSLDDKATFELGHDKTFFINPGSVGQPRDGDPRAAFGILDTKQNMYTLVRVEYPIDEAAQRIVQAGLPHFLAERLFLGR